jgi:hypothetical protein
MGKKCGCNPKLGYKVCREGKKLVHHKNMKCSKSKAKKKSLLPSLPEFPTVE